METVKVTNVLTMRARIVPRTNTICTCGDCGRSWDDAIVTGVTPTPAGRCPFEHLHKAPKVKRSGYTNLEFNALPAWARDLILKLERDAKNAKAMRAALDYADEQLTRFMPEELARLGLGAAMSKIRDAIQQSKAQS